MSNKPNVDELDIKGTVLRPLADKFLELARQIDSGEYELPKTVADAEKITEGYINQAWGRLAPIIAKARQQTCDDIVGLVPKETSVDSVVLGNSRPLVERRVMSLAYNKCRTQTIDAINKYKGEI